MVLLTSCNADEQQSDSTAAETEKPAETETIETAETESETEVTKNLSIAALGDSITRGFGLADVTGDRFTTLICDMLEEDGVSVKLANYGVDGITSGELLDELEAGYYTAVRATDVVTLCIGANNILGAGFSFLEAYMTYEGDALTESYEQFREEADAGVETLRENLPVILETIRKLNPDCRIILLNLYNPYAHIDLSLNSIRFGMTIGSLTDEYIQKLNAITESYADDNTGLVDVYGAFSGREADFIYAYAEDGKLVNVDPHPNADGHEMIADAVYNAEFTVYEEE